MEHQVGLGVVGPGLAFDRERDVVRGEILVRVPDNDTVDGDQPALDEAKAHAPRAEALREENVVQLHFRESVPSCGVSEVCKSSSSILRIWLHCC